MPCLYPFPYSLLPTPYSLPLQGVVNMGSVKDLTVTKSPRENAFGEGYFTFSDRYSVFDWGEMPDHIPGKGESLCLMGAYFFERLGEAGWKTHYRGLISNGESKLLKDVKEPTRRMKVALVRVIHPPLVGDSYDYGVYRSNETNFLVPFEFIYRNTLPKGSSFRRRAEKGQIRLDDYGLHSLPSPEVVLERPILDVSTKLEEQDRYLSWEEAASLNILTPEEIERAQDILVQADQMITGVCSNIGLQNEDGKIELALDPNREFLFVDVLGTPDECRFTCQGIHLSKEVARDFYRSTPWYEELQEIKDKDPVGWKERVTSQPPHLPKELTKAIGWLYQRLAVDFTGYNWFPEVPALENILDELKKFR